MKHCTSTFLILGVILAAALPASADLIYQVKVDTSSLKGTAGFLDFTFAGGIPTPPAATLAISGFTSDATLGTSFVSGTANGFLTSQVTMDNSPGYNDFYQTINNFGKSIQFTVDIGGAAVTSPDGISGSSTFAFTVLDSTGSNPLLVPNPLQPANPGGAAFIVDLNHQGTDTVSNFSGPTSIQNGPNVVPEPRALSIPVAVLGLCLAGIRRRGLFALKK